MTSTHNSDEDEADNPFFIPQPTLEQQEEEQTEQLQQSCHLPSINSTLTITHLPSKGLSFQIWPAANTLLTLLTQFHLHPTTSPLSPFLPTSPNPLRILELGSGTGLVGIAAAALLSAKVTLTDLPHVLPNLTLNAAANSKAVRARGGDVEVRALRWGEEEDEMEIGGDFDVVLGSDLVYDDKMYETLLKTLGVLLVNPKVVFVMAHSKRWKKESGFFKKAKKMFRVEVVYSANPAPGERIGIVVYSFAKRGGN